MAVVAGRLSAILSLHSAARVLILDMHCIEFCIRRIKFAIRLLRVSCRVLMLGICAAQAGKRGLLERGFGPRAGQPGAEEAESVPRLENGCWRMANFTGGVA